jgi:hypothetical protein
MATLACQNNPNNNNNNNNRHPASSIKTLNPRDEAALAFLRRHNKKATAEKIDQTRSVLVQYNLTLTHNVPSPRVQAYLDDL